jgi:serine/threonine protein kinase
MLFNKNGGDILKSVGINLFTKAELKAITKSYSIRVGGGFFGDVYKGTIQDGAQTQHVAVKCTVTKKLARLRQNQLRRDAPQHEQEEAWKDGFVKEITFQFQIKHPNVVRLIGCCLETDVPILVFEYVNNGSLHDKLHVANKQCYISLIQRLDIAIGSAQALSHIHSHGEYNHVHGDIKPANILLDENLEAKVSDFGSSKLLSVNKYVEDVATDGNYADPVYYKTGRFTVKSDVYSFGVVLLEIITRKTSRYGENRSLPIDFEKSWVDEDQRWSMYDPDILSDDPILKKCLDMVGALAVECLNSDADKRPTMGEVVVELKKVKSIAYGGSCFGGPIVDEASKHAGSA